VAASRATAIDARRRFGGAMEVYLESCYATRSVVRVSELALMVGLSRQRFVETMTRSFGKPPAELLRDRQLEYAIGLLKGTPLPMSDVAACSGFGDRSTLYRAFMRKYGMSPSRFRHLDNMQRSEERKAR